MGAITDIAHFALGDQAPAVSDAADDREPVTIQIAPGGVGIQHHAWLPETAYLKALKEGKLLGGRTGQGWEVVFPCPRGGSGHRQGSR